MASVTPPGLPLWAEYPRFVHRHLPLIAGLVLAGLLAGLVWSWGRPTTYSATASVVLAPVPKYLTASTVALVPPSTTIDTDAQLLQSPAVLGAVAAELGEDDRDGRLIDRLSVTASPHTRVLHVTVSAGSAHAAADAADAAVAALATVRRDHLGALTTAQLRQLRRHIDDQERLLAEEAARGPLIPALDVLSAEVLELEVGLAGLEEAHDRPLDAITPAVPPRRADHANTEVPLTSGAMVGLLSGCLAGAALDRTARRRRPASTSTPTRRVGDLPHAPLHR